MIQTIIAMKTKSRKVNELRKGKKSLKKRLVWILERVL
jgi:hypothetical protein